MGITPWHRAKMSYAPEWRPLLLLCLVLVFVDKWNSKQRVKIRNRYNQHRKQYGKAIKKQEYITYKRAISNFKAEVTYVSE